VTSVLPIKPILAAGIGSHMRPAITPPKIAKKLHAYYANPAGTGIIAIIPATANGTTACDEPFISPPFRKLIGNYLSEPTRIALFALPLGGPQP
jgi:hypothetical protein